MKHIITTSIILNSFSVILAIDPYVLTPQGLIKGLNSENGDYSMFMGVPYAVVDKENPFGNCIPHPGFEDVFEAYDDTIVCPQYVDDNAIGTIDCLQLNIYVPHNASSKNALPVILFIHGGSFVAGSKQHENFDPKFLIQHDVIVVVINYRLGPYGFLCVSSPEYNNQGIRDQILAMRWVKDNIKAFGGDVNKITIMGQSAGAMTIDLILLVLEEKLFARAIIQSGPALNPWVVSLEDNSLVVRLANYFGFNRENSTAAVEFLSSIDPIDVVSAMSNLGLTYKNGHPFTRPCIEKNGTNRLLKEFPINLLPKVKNLDLMIGNTNREVMFIYPKSDKDYYESYQFSNELITGFDEIYDEDIMRHFYIGDRAASQDEISRILDYGSDFAFAYPVERTIKRYLDNNANKVYRYMFAYEGGRNRVKIIQNLTTEGASHGDDLGYIFDSKMFSGNPTLEDQSMIDKMTAMWANFAKYGDPTPTTSELLPIKWEPVNEKVQHYMHIDAPLEARMRPFHERMAFWALYYKTHGNVEKGYKGKV